MTTPNFGNTFHRFTHSGYLWKLQRFADGHFDAVLSSRETPGYPLAYGHASTITFAMHAALEMLAEKEVKR